MSESMLPLPLRPAQSEGRSCSSSFVRRSFVRSFPPLRGYADRWDTASHSHHGCLAAKTAAMAAITAQRERCPRGQVLESRKNDVTTRHGPSGCVRARSRSSLVTSAVVIATAARVCGPGPGSNAASACRRRIMLTACGVASSPGFNHPRQSSVS